MVNDGVQSAVIREPKTARTGTSLFSGAAHSLLSALRTRRMTALYRWSRRVPIMLFAVFGGTALILCNPGYFWDDWVWLYQSPQDSIRIGKELGVFWGGYLTNAINALSHPSLMMRLTALVAWLIAAAAAARVLYRQRKLSADDAFQYFLLYAVTHVALIRFLTSVAMYNVYIACFWVGWVVLLMPLKRRMTRWVSLPFFFLSFYLNALIALFGAMLVLRAARVVGPQLEWPAAAWRWRGVRACLDQWPVLARRLLRQSGPPLRRFATEHLALLALPFVFLCIKHATTVPSLLYDDYNRIDRRKFISALFDAFLLIRPVLRDFFTSLTRDVQPALLVGCCGLCFLLLRVAPRRVSSTSPQMACFQTALGWILFAAATYPYILAGKLPDLRDFYESRHILPAVAGLTLVLIGLTNVLDLSFSRVIVLRRIGRDALLGYMLGASVASSVGTGFDLWRDWIRQTAIMAFIQTHAAQLNGIGTFVFDDAGDRIGDRKLWNYEYTGNLVTVYRTRERLGVPVDEYRSWPPGVLLLANPLLRQRFNFGGFDIKQPHALITVRPTATTLTVPDIMSIVRADWLGTRWQQHLGRYLSIQIAYEYTEADQRIAEMRTIANALAAYRHDHGNYPATSPLPKHGVPTRNVTSGGAIGPALIRGDIPGLFPTYLPRPQTMIPRCDNAPAYLYLSDGLDYKLVYANPLDFPYAKQRYPQHIDMGRSAYGIWTKSAKSW